MEIRHACGNDVAQWMELLELVKDNFPGLDMEDYRKVLSDRIEGQCALAAIEDNKLVGELLFSKQTKETEFLAVHPNFRGLGTATAIIRHMFTLFPKGSRFTVTTYREDDGQGMAARELYRKIGFVPGRLLTVFDYPCQELVFDCN